MSEILEIKNLSKSYNGKKYALQNCSFSLTKGKVCAIVGESGSGKTTLLRLIAGLERPNTGSIIIDKKIVSNDEKISLPKERKVGMVFQDYALFPHLTVEENIGFGLKENKKEKILDMLSLIQMKAYAKSYPSELSGGQEQRVAIARTLALEPKLLLLDEPFSNLDLALKSKLRKEISKITKQVGITLVFITHDIFDAIDIADEIVFLKEGNIIQNSATKNFIRNSKDEEINKMISDLKTNINQFLSLEENRTDD